MKRIGLLGIYHESNTFLDQPTTLQHFEEGHLFRGDRILLEYQHAYHEIGGIIEGLSRPDISLIPLLYAEATPGGKIDAQTTQQLLSMLKEALEAGLPLDGLMVVPHGAAVSELYDDFDGHWLTELRKYIGAIPVIGTLDPHANISQSMVEATDALIAYETNPHIDQRQTGKLAAQLMLDTLDQRIKPIQRLRQTQVAISIEQQYTAQPPCLPMYEMAKVLGDQPGILAVSVLLGFPYADVYEMGSAFLVVSDNDGHLAEDVLSQLDHYLIDHHADFQGVKTSVEEAIFALQDLPKPVLLLDMGDNVGGGSPGDSTFLLHALEDERLGKAFICINDPGVVSELRPCIPGESREITLGGKSDLRHGLPLTTRVRLGNLVDGKFAESEARHGGQVRFDMGPTAIVETTGGTTIMITSKRTVPFSLQQLLHFNVDPASFDVIVAKGVQAPIAAYAPVCPSLIRVNTDGVTTADMKKMVYHKRRKPLFPFEEINSPNA